MGWLLGLGREVPDDVEAPEVDDQLHAVQVSESGDDCPRGREVASDEVEQPDPGHVGAFDEHVEDEEGEVEDDD